MDPGFGIVFRHYVAGKHPVEGCDVTGAVGSCPHRPFHPLSDAPRQDFPDILVSSPHYSHPLGPSHS